MTTPCPMSLLPRAENPVWPEVSASADVLNIGFAPGREEVEYGRPFVGASGKLLRAWLDSAGLLARSAFINVEQHRTYDLQCRKCGVEYWFAERKLRPTVEVVRAYQFAVLFRDSTGLSGDSAKGKRAPRAPKRPSKTQYATIERYAGALTCEHQWRQVNSNRKPKKDENCGLPLIRRLLGTRDWKLVLCWGDVPAREIGGYAGSVGSMVGRFRTLSTGQPCTVLYHPAFLLRQRGTLQYGANEALIKEILRQGRDRIESPTQYGTGLYPFVVLPEQSVPRIHEGSVVDIETQVAGKNPDPRHDKSVQLVVGHANSPDVLLRDLEGYKDRVEVEHGARLQMHHAQYDIPILAKLCGHLDFTADDSMVMAYLDGEPILGLKPLARRRLGLAAREYLEKVGPEDHEYDAQDAHLTRELIKYYSPRLKAKGLWFLYNEVKVPLQRVMARHVLQGLKIDHERIVALRAKMLERAASLRQAMFHEYGKEFNLGKAGTTDDVENIIFDHYKVPPFIDPKTREPVRTTAETYIGEFRHIPFVALLLGYRRAMSYENRYTAKMSSMDRISGLYDLTGTGTDRVSQHDDNCMNFPGLVKACIMADEGGYFVYGDYSQLELRLAAYFSKDQYLTSVIREGRNMHEELCIALFGARTPEQYTKSKSKNFARLYGAGKKRQARTLGLPMDIMLANEVPWDSWDDWVETRRLEPARTFWNYERPLDEERESSDERVRDKVNRQIINSIIQGTAGEINQYAQVLGDRYLSELGGYVIHQEHDSVLGWVPNSVPPDEAKLALSTAMAEAGPRDIQDYVPLPAKVIYGSHWA